MSRAAQAAGTTTTFSATTMTLLFVDIDGVLNIGIGDKGNAPFSLNTDNIAIAGKKNAKSRCAQLLLGVACVQVDQENTTYGELCKGSPQLADIYVKRLADLIAAAKSQGKLMCVLSSTWRTQNVPGVRVLEQKVSKHLGEPFTFDAETDTQEFRGRGGRLEIIGKFLSDWAATSTENFDNVRALVLEDFHITPLDGWSCHEKDMTCTQDVDKLLRSCLPRKMNAATCLIHTFDQWTTDSGLLLQVGSGLTMKHFQRAMAFLSDNTAGNGKLAIAGVKADGSTHGSDESTESDGSNDGSTHGSIHGSNDGSVERSDESPSP
jgi:hypothetical protein